jgi:serine phosphatase RsbU (regulator of sigma subunit)
VVRVVEGAEDLAQRLGLVLRAGGFGTFVWDRATGRTTWDAELEAVFGLPSGGFEGTYDGWVSRLHPDDRQHIVDSVQAAVTRRGSYEVRHRIVWPDGSTHWVEGLGQVTVGPDGAVTGTIGCTRDVTTQVILEQELANAAEAAVHSARRSERLLAVTTDLARALSVQDVTAVLTAQLGALVGACSAAFALLSRRGGSLRVMASFGFDPDAVRSFARVPLTAHAPMTDCVRTGQRVVVSGQELIRSYPHLAGDSAGTPHTLIAALPLSVPGRRLGSLLLAFSDRTSISEDDVMLAEAIAAQCSQALDRARLIERLGEVAITMQQGLAPGLFDDLPGFDVAAVYRAGGDEMEHLGGDWYDVLTMPSGTSALVIGDVMGRGVSAATTMTRLRTAARAYVWDDPDPKTVMVKLDAFVQREAPDDFVTMVYATLDTATGRLAVVNAGHLPAVILPQGQPCRLLEAGGGLPLGLTSSPRSVEQLELDDGGGLLLYTDGLVERRDRDLDTGLGALLQACAAPLPSTDLQEFLSRLVESLVIDQAPGDDVTALMIRRRTTTQPRTGLAGRRAQAGASPSGSER